MLESIGWIATALFASSYFFKEQTVLRRVQAGAACLWIAYGLMISAYPVVASNVIVAGIALYTSFQPRTVAPQEGQASST